MKRALRTCFVTLLAAGGANCQPPGGTYTSCAQWAHGPQGRGFVDAAGFQDGARLTVEQSGSAVTMNYADQNGLRESLEFSAGTGGVASITRKGQAVAGFRSQCVAAPGRGAGYPASMSVTAGALTWEAGMVFVTLTGELRSEAGECGTLRQAGGSFWLACTERQGGGVALKEAPPAVAAARLPGGRYSCLSQVESVGVQNGRKEYAAGGAAGTLILSREGAKVMARYSGDASVAGMLRFTGTGSSSARADGGQGVMVSCAGGGGRREILGRAEVSAGALAMIGSTLFVSFAGAMGEGSSCAGVQVAGSLICVR